MSTQDAAERIAAAISFLRAIFEPEDWIEVRLLPCGVSRWFQLRDEPQMMATLEWAAERNARPQAPENVHFGVHPRKSAGKRGDDNVALFRVLIADFDKTKPEDAVAAWQAAGLPGPSIVLSSGGGAHAYALLDEPITDAAQYRSIIKGIAAAAKSDRSVHNPERLLRVPGFDNVKPELPARPLCHVTSMKDTRHPVAAFPAGSAPRKPAGDTSSPRRPARRPLCDVGRRFIETGRVDRPRGETLFTIACDMKACGWHVEEAIRAVMERAAKVFGPDEQQRIDDLERQIRNAFKQDREPGHTSAPATNGHATTATDADNRPRRRLVLVRASDIECSEINWLWPQRIVGDGLTIITGPVGISKSLISVDVAARVTTGGKWPDSTGHAQQGSVILFGAEDDAGKVVVPRLMAAGADLSRVHVCQGTISDDDGDGEGEQSPEVAAMILERHIGELRAALDDVADCRLIVFDPLPDYIAADENKSAEVRAALVPLARLAQERNVAVVAVAHQNKKNDLTTVQRIAGSSAFAQIARVVLSIGTHPEDADKQAGKRRVMLVSKNNYGPRDVGQAYAIETRASGQPGLVWQAGTLTMDADEIARRPTGGREHEGRRGEAVDALRDLLEMGEQSAAAITARLQDTGLGRRQIDHAASVLNVVKRKLRDGWYWRLPRRGSENSGPQPEPAFAAWAPPEIDDFNRT